MGVFENFSGLFLSVWQKGILGVNFVEILIGLGIFFIFLVFRGLISKLIIKKLEFSVYYVLFKSLRLLGLLLAVTDTSESLTT